MIIYKDIFSDDELVSDTFKLNVVDGVLFEADCKLIQKKTNEDIQLEGANPSAEDGEDDAGGEGGTVQVLDIQDQFRYMKKVHTKLKENNTPQAEIDEFTKNAQTGLKKILGNFKNYDMFIGESFDADSMLVLIDYREDGVTPYATLWKHGLKEMKV
ncbi:hypothetical protein ABOM_004021 [Aspergillus bombycis]|uniref:Translationally-controlled tumor protein homolog n=1 Tax=Aspergillus bombycis TaxID=109264 RepID=A0A1F8AC19_9EURO|nr:hypothetical protein ABOM_004021 [Aspergillus bombycis]OGM49262.1 hypothetical protein ABOM_004021 [Aspergillus bombycis]